MTKWRWVGTRRYKSRNDRVKQLYTLLADVIWCSYVLWQTYSFLISPSSAYWLSTDGIPRIFISSGKRKKNFYTLLILVNIINKIIHFRQRPCQRQAVVSAAEITNLSSRNWSRSFINVTRSCTHSIEYIYDTHRSGFRNTDHNSHNDKSCMCIHILKDFLCFYVVKLWTIIQRWLFGWMAAPSPLPPAPSSFSSFAFSDVVWYCGTTRRRCWWCFLWFMYQIIKIRDMSFKHKNYKFYAIYVSEEKHKHIFFLLIFSFFFNFSPILF